MENFRHEAPKSANFVVVVVVVVVLGGELKKLNLKIH